MIESLLPPRRLALLYLGFYLALAAVVARGLSQYFSPSFEGFGLRWAVVGLLVAFAVFAVARHLCNSPLTRCPNLYIGLQKGLVLSLLLLPPHLDFFGVLYFLLSVPAMLACSQRVGYLWIASFTVITAGAFVYAYGWQDGLAFTLLYAAGYYFSVPSPPQRHGPRPPAWRARPC